MPAMTAALAIVRDGVALRASMGITGGVPSNPVRVASLCITLRKRQGARGVWNCWATLKLAREIRAVRADRANVRTRAAVCPGASRSGLRSAERRS